MKFTKQDIKSINYYNFVIKKTMNIIKLYENRIKNEIPKNIKINLFKYGFYVGRIYEIIDRRTDFKDETKNLNFDTLIKETFGEPFYKWLTGGNKQFIYGDNNSNIDTSDINIMHN